MLEREWGTAKFNVFYGFCILLNVVVGFLLYAVTAPLYPSHLLPLLTTASMTYVNLSPFFAFATLYPNMQVLLFFIIPIKIKWLAWTTLPRSAGASSAALWRLPPACRPPGVIIPLAAILNYFIFFWDNFSSSSAGSNTRPPARPSTQEGHQAGPAAEGLYPQVRRLRQDRHRLPQRGISLLLQVQRLLLLLFGAHPQPRSHTIKSADGLQAVRRVFVTGLRFPTPYSVT
ncbi:MAG: hypothetical protein ACLTYN_15725 [Dysosmobacter welbionis]